MATTGDAGEKKNAYFIDTESAAEMARLLNQDRIITKAMGGLLAEQSPEKIASFKTVLDVGCGPGGWVQEMAFAYPDKEVVGIDISQQMIDYARAQAGVQRLNNTRFLVMDATQPLDFPDSSFDLVNARTLAFLPPSLWPKLMQEYFRLLRPGGVIRLTESEWGFTNSPAYERLNGWFCHAMKLAGQSFSPDGRISGITPMLGGFLRDVGCINIQQVASVVDFSFGAEAYESEFHNKGSLFKLIQPFIRKWEGVSQEELDSVYEQLLIEMRLENFRAIQFMLTAWGEKP
ncbi:MAG TPA: methyltransferase domain-containing protein [Ktedonobacteraceae bacterium]|nr:methyltransferase domain-containing protein [Ktedonobacteraceae bacterium]